MLQTLTKYGRVFFAAFVGMMGLAWMYTLPANEGAVYVYDSEPLTHGQNLVFYTVSYGGDATVTYPLFLAITPCAQPLAKEAIPGPSPFGTPIFVMRHGYNIEYELQGRTLTIYYPGSAKIDARKSSGAGYDIVWKKTESHYGFINYADTKNAAENPLRKHQSHGTLPSGETLKP